MKEALVILVIILLFGVIYLLYDKYSPYEVSSKQIVDSIAVINHPPIINHELREFKISISLDDSIRTVTADKDTNQIGDTVYSYSDTFNYKSDSLEFSVTANNKINSKNLESSIFTWSNISIKPLMTIITERIDSVIYRTALKEVSLPFYKDEWFWSTIGSILLIISVII